MDLLEIFKTSILYIEDHLTDKISVKDVADHASVSNFYFQRMFSAFTGMNVGDYIRQRRLSLAAQELLIDDAKIIDLAYTYGYETLKALPVPSVGIMQSFLMKSRNILIN